ncbi:hypothetical protein D6C00_14530 [Thiohalobacter thiocyanaticus]|uniref:Uncharacterized protein n=1 Tax=Thiohalobacter thiocyanaticus TaxID=585455 RepID=A0A426QE30_9GAMM|nr:hypothetical protein D6C00_14530 [Thiohalobacter thiocyanaticus]
MKSATEYTENTENNEYDVGNIRQLSVIPAYAGIQMLLRLIDSCMRRNDVTEEEGTSKAIMNLSVLSVYSVALFHKKQLTGVT